VFAGDVRGMFREALRPLHGTYTDDAARPFHRFELGAEGVHHARQIHTDDEIPLIVFEVLDGAGPVVFADDASTVGSAIQFTELGDDALDPRIDGRAIGDIDFGREKAVGAF
jgi:hypothetical protein